MKIIKKETDSKINLLQILPLELLYLIIGNDQGSAGDLLRIGRVNQFFYNLTLSDFFWKKWWQQLDQHIQQYSSEYSPELLNQFIYSHSTQQNLIAYRINFISTLKEIYYLDNYPPRGILMGFTNKQITDFFGSFVRAKEKLVYLLDHLKKFRGSVNLMLMRNQLSLCELIAKIENSSIQHLQEAVIKLRSTKNFQQLLLARDKWSIFFDWIAPEPIWQYIFYTASSFQYSTKLADTLRVFILLNMKFQPNHALEMFSKVCELLQREEDSFQNLLKISEFFNAFERLHSSIWNFLLDQLRDHGSKVVINGSNFLQLAQWIEIGYQNFYVFYQINSKIFCAFLEWRAEKYCILRSSDNQDCLKGNDKHFFRCLSFFVFPNKDSVINYLNKRLWDQLVELSLSVTHQELMNSVKVLDIFLENPTAWWLLEYLDPITVLTSSVNIIHVLVGNDRNHTLSKDWNYNNKHAYNMFCNALIRQGGLSCTSTQNSQELYSQFESLPTQIYFQTNPSQEIFSTYKNETVEQFRVIYDFYVNFLFHGHQLFGFPRIIDENTANFLFKETKNHPSTWLKDYQNTYFTGSKKKNTPNEAILKNHPWVLKYISSRALIEIMKGLLNAPSLPGLFQIIREEAFERGILQFKRVKEEQGLYFFDLLTQNILALNATQMKNFKAQYDIRIEKAESLVKQVLSTTTPPPIVPPWSPGFPWGHNHSVELRNTQAANIPSDSPPPNKFSTVPINMRNVPINMGNPTNNIPPVPLIRGLFVCNPRDVYPNQSSPLVIPRGLINNVPPLKSSSNTPNDTDQKDDKDDEDKNIGSTL